MQDGRIVTDHLRNLPMPNGRVQCEHVWIDGSLKNFRTKSKTWNEGEEAELPPMEFCGSATDFDVGNLADYYAHPVRFFRDPFRGGANKLIFCDTYSNQKLPTFANNRYRLVAAEQKFQKDLKFSFFQSYSLVRRDGRLLSYMNPAYDEDSKAHYSCGKPLAEAHYRACLYSQVDMASLEDLSGLGQWRYSVGPSASVVHLGDHVWMSRYLLQRVGEDFGVAVSLDTTPVVVSSLLVETGPEDRARKEQIATAFTSKFVSHEHREVTVQSLSRGILLTGLHADVDPYALCTKAGEALANLR